MIAAVLEVGPQLAALLTPIAAGAAGWFGTRRARQQLRPNGGKSLADAVNRIEATVNTFDARISRLEHEVLEGY